MKKIFAIFLLIVIFSAVFIAHSSAAVEWSVIRTLNLEHPPRDVAVSYDGKRIFVLDDNGNILIYTPEGNLTDTITVDKDIDGIRLGRMEDVLFLSSQKSKKVQLVLLDFIQVIDITGSPYKGPDNAPVVIAVFNDFE
jgi:hypothetical protein